MSESDENVEAEEQPGHQSVDDSPEAGVDSGANLRIADPGGERVMVEIIPSWLVIHYDVLYHNDCHCVHNDEYG